MIGNNMDQSEGSPTTVKKIWLAVMTVFALAILYTVSIRLGVVFGLFGFNPDCCWILRMGQIICQSGSLPKEDPFSYALQIAAQVGDRQPYVIYQWLSEVIFFNAYMLLNLVQIIAVTAVIYAFTFITIPFRSGLRFNVPRSLLLGLIVLVSLTSNLRGYVRPEVFSYFITAILLYVLQSARLKYGDTSHSHIGWRTIGGLILLLVVSCNVHITFCVHLLLLAVYASAFCIEDLINHRSLSMVSKTLVIGTVLSTLATLINPYGFGLWVHVPRLLYSPLAPNVVELQPLTYNLVATDILYYPFVVMLALCFISVATCIFLEWRDKRLNLSPLRLLSLLLIAASIFFTFHRIRYIAIASLIVAFELPSFIAYGNKLLFDSETKPLWKRKISILAIEIGVALSVCFGVYGIVNTTTPVSIPMARTDFDPPFLGIRYLLEHYNSGRLFADHEITDMCELYLPFCKVFQDTRFDGYDVVITSDYVKILKAEAQWQEILEGYKIEWVVARPHQPIAKSLLTVPGWKIVYQDKTCVIFHKT
jgi:hypothetical protein